MTVLRLADDDETAGLAAYLGRLVAFDDRAAVRLQGSGTVLGVWGGPPMDVLTLRPVGLGTALTEPLDLTVSVRRLLDVVDGSVLDGTDLELPPSVTGPAWAGLLPPRGGWQEVAVVPASTVDDAVRVAVEAFRRRVEQLPVAERQSQPALEAVAREVWSRPVLAGIPLRAAHAADVIGLLARDGEVRALEAGPWQRLACPGGSVLLRRDGAGTGLGLDLGVWSLLGPPPAGSPGAP